MSAKNLVEHELSCELPEYPGQRWTPKMRRFVYHYVREGGDVAKAAKNAGYASKDSCYHLLEKEAVNAAIQDELLACLQKDGENSETIIARWSKWINANVYDYFKMDQDGNLVAIDPKELTPDQKAAVRKLTITNNQYGQNVTIELEDRAKAQDRLAEILGLINSQQQGQSAADIAHGIRDLVSKMDENRAGNEAANVTLN